MTSSSSENKILNVFGQVLTIENELFNHLNSLSASSHDDGDRKLLKKLKTVILNFFFIKSVESTQAEFDTNFVRMIIDILNELYPYYVKIFDKQLSSDNSELYINLLKIIEYIVPQTVIVLNCFAFDYITFCNKFIENNGLKILFDYVSNPILLQSYVKNSANVESSKFKGIDETLRYIMGSLVCLARVYSNYKKAWKECNAAAIFLNYSNVTKSIADNKIYACMAIAFVAEEEDIDTLPDLKDVIPDLVKLCAKAAKMIQENENLIRNKIELDDSENEIAEVCVVRSGDNENDTQWSLVNLLKALYHLGVHDKLKYEIYYKNHMNRYLKSIIYNGNYIEQEYSLNLLWQLCFDKQISNDVREDHIFYDFIENLSIPKGVLHKKLENCASGIIWLINKKIYEEVQPKESVVQESNADKRKISSPKVEENIGKHIMISYNRDSRDLCLKIKSELENQNLKVWIDVEAISGSSLESMANAIENSFCILMCMTEKYKQSPNCRAEAEYAFTLNKPIIPLIMQKDYKPDGWLGIILGSKIFVNFTRYEYSECIRRLNVELQAVQNFPKLLRAAIELKENPVINMSKDENSMYKIVVDNLLNKEKESTNVDKKNQLTSIEMKPHIEQKVPIKQNKNINELNWSEIEVENWCKEKSIHPNIENHLKPCNGKLLYEFFLIKNESPDFFYRQLAISKMSSTKPVMIRDLAIFTLELKKIFNS